MVQPTPPTRLVPARRARRGSRQFPAAAAGARRWCSAGGRVPSIALRVIGVLDWSRRWCRW
jgi:hypothetical protein